MATERADTGKNGLRILVLGSVGPNQDRILALADRGNTIVYAYTEFHPNIVRLYPNIMCIPVPRRNLVPMLGTLISMHRLTMVYSLLNAHDDSTEVTLELMDARFGIPIVRHYKEHPCVPTEDERRLLLSSDAQIYINKRSYEYFRNVYRVSPDSAYTVDADMIAAKYMHDDFSTKLRLSDGQPHVLIAGGVSVLKNRLDYREFCLEMALRRVHTHIYGYWIGEDSQGQVVVPHLPTEEAYRQLAGSSRYIHLHPLVQSEAFSREWSQYDAGMMHASVSREHHEADFERINLPYRPPRRLAWVEGGGTLARGDCSPHLRRFLVRLGRAVS